MKQSTELRIYLLGQMRIEREGIRIHLPRRKVESLLAYLILHPELQGRDHLATLYWGDSSDSQARNSLRTALVTLRQLVSPDLLLTDRDHVQLNPAFPLWVDLHQLLALGDELDQTSSDSLHAQLALWQDDLLAGFYDDWIIIEREHYRTRLLKLFLQSTQTLRARSEYGQAIAVAQRVLALDPANEHAHQHLMFCYVADGNRPAALRQYKLCEQALREDLDVQPLPETTALYQWIKQYDGEALSSAGKVTNLPIPLTSFVGRRRETAEVKRLLSLGPTGSDPQETESKGAIRLLTLTGAGGSGKTRLAIQAATDLIDSFAHGVWWVELAALGSGELVTRAVATTLGVNEVADQPLIQALAKFVRDKEMLLAFDNCEHLIEACAGVAAELLGHCPQLQILATSREPLNLAGETLWQVSPFAAPDPSQQAQASLLLQFESVRLFVERATTVQPNFALTNENAQAVAEICRQLDGIPLAIELAAARVKVLSVEQIATYLAGALGARFALLTQGNRATQPRHQTLRATIDWSYNLLGEAERLLFRQVAVFRGGFTLEALEQIVGSEPNSPLPSIHTTLDLLTQLVDKSLVIVEPLGGQNRYRLLETLREYALEKLRVAGEESLWRARHAGWYLELAKRAAPELEGIEQLYWLERIEREHDNLRAALAWFAATPGGVESGLQLSCAIGYFWCIRFYLSEGQRWLETFLHQIDPETVLESQVDAINFLGRISRFQSNFQSARLHYERALALARKIEYDEGIQTALLGLGTTLWELGDFQKARARLEEVVRHARTLGHLKVLAHALNNLGLVYMHQGDHEVARAALNECLLIYQQLGNKVGIAPALFNLAILAGYEGDFTRARLLYEQALAIDRELGRRQSVADGLNNIGDLAVCDGDLAVAAAYYEEAAQIYRELGDIASTAYTSTGLGDIAFYTGDYAEARTRYAEALALFREARNQRLISRVLGQLGRIACRQGDLVAAATLGGEALTIRHAIGHKPGMAVVLDQNFVELALASGRPVVAVRILGAVASARRAITRPRDPIETRQLEPHLARMRAQLGDVAMAVAWAEGEAMSLEEVVAYTLETLSPTRVSQN